MHQTLFTKIGAAVAIGLGLAALPASAAGLLGERYATLSYDPVFVNLDAYDNGDGFTAFYNQSWTETVDFGVGYSYQAYGDADGRDEVGDFSDQRIHLVATAFGEPEQNRVWARIGVGLGRVEHGDRDVTSLSWLALVGTEYLVGDKVVLHPYAGWSNVLNDGETTRFVYGVQTVFDATDKVGVSVRLEGDHHYNVVFSIGGLFRF